MKKVIKRKIKIKILFPLIIMLLAILACEPSAETPVYQNGTPTPHIITINFDLSDSSFEECISGITPGATNLGEVYSLLSTPYFSERSGDFETLFYFSQEKKQAHSIELKNDIVQMVSAIIVSQNNPVLLSELQTKLGQAEDERFSYNRKGAHTYLYPSIGKAFIASPEKDEVWVHQCFQPITLEEYLNSWGSDLPSEDPFAR